MNRRYIYLIIAFLGVMVLLAAMPTSVDALIGIRFTDIPVHMLAFGVFAGLITLGMYHAKRPYGTWTLFFVPGIIASLGGVVGELMQHFLPTRSFGYLDMAANIIGAFGAQVFICFIWLRVHVPVVYPSKQALKRKAMREKGIRHEFVPIQKPKTNKDGMNAAEDPDAANEQDEPPPHSIPKATKRTRRTGAGKGRQRHKFVPLNKKSDAEQESS